MDRKEMIPLTLSAAGGSPKGRGDKRAGTGPAPTERERGRGSATADIARTKRESLAYE